MHDIGREKLEEPSVRSVPEGLLVHPVDFASTSNDSSLEELCCLIGKLSE